MFDIRKLGGMLKQENNKLSKDQIANILKTTPGALDAFEKAYAAAPIDDSDNLFDINAKDMAAAMSAKTNAVDENLQSMKDRIVNELLSKTVVWSYDGEKNDAEIFLPDEGCIPVTNTEINALPEAIRPQLTGSLMKVDIAGESYKALLESYAASQNMKLPEHVRRQHYHMFRQGLDILDYDPIMYEIIKTNPNSMGHWLPALVENINSQSFFKIPKTKIMSVPMTVLQLTRQEYTELSRTTLDIVDDFCYRAFGLDDTKDYFIKTGTYSSKFDFRNAKVAKGDEVHDLGEYLLFIHFQANAAASPLSSPVIYGMSTTTEWVVREFIEDKENNPCIYHGLPLHTEYRVFVDFDDKTVIGISPYWEPETMKNRFDRSDKADDIHDSVIYAAHEETLMRRYDENKDKVIENLQKFIQNVNLHGQWSVDIMQNGDDFYIIDMATAETSAFYNCVPAHLRRPAAENWLPMIPTESNGNPFE